MKHDPLNYNDRKPTPIWVYQVRTEWTIYLGKKKKKKQHRVQKVVTFEHV